MEARSSNLYHRISFTGTKYCINWYACSVPSTDGQKFTRHVNYPGQLHVHTGLPWLETRYGVHCTPVSSSGRQPQHCSSDSRSMPSDELMRMWLRMHVSSSHEHLARVYRRDGVPSARPACMPGRLQEDGAMRADSVRRKRKTKMNKHKHRKRLKKMRHGAK